jgi:UDP-N-acetylglucosamine--dolichyl-phosphate N-acetylglucosaminephosphotransferase
MEPLLIIPVILSFFVTLIAMPSWIKRAKKGGLQGKDINKFDKPLVAESGGVIVMGGFIIGILSYVAIKTFKPIPDGFDATVQIFALLSSIMIVAFVGLLDDILGWKIGLGKRIRIFLVLIAAIPLMVINAGESAITLPLIGKISLQLIYPIIIIPIGIVGAGTTFNFLAGYNGLEAGQGIILISALSLVSYLTGSSWLALIGLCMVASLIAFLIFNRFPAKVFPGDVLTYPLGALIAIFAILGNFEKIAIFFFIPYIAETLLKLRAGIKLDKESFSKPNGDNSLEMPYNKIYGLEHLAIFVLKKVKKSKKVYEKEVVYFIHALQIAIIVLGLIIFKNNLVIK